MSFFQKSIRSDEDLLSALREGSEDAFTVIYERYHKLLYVLKFICRGRCRAASILEAVGVAFLVDDKRKLAELSLYDAEKPCVE